MTNRLADATSPYLLQHADNPVDWYRWGEEAIGKAKREDKPIFLSIGYAACHWCHVMAHESFEDSETAAILNKHFVPIKVDREERPDLDGIYMAAVTALTGQGGWPMSVFLTPGLEPFYGGTYFPPRPMHGLPAFKEVLLTLARYWLEKRAELLSTGENVARHLQEQVRGREQAGQFSPDALAGATRHLVQSYDWQHGGWGRAPKFPQAMALDFLLIQREPENKKRIELVEHALRAMARGGMYDVVGGGFSRYSTDNEWRVPHFEKMLYDNALMARAYLHAYQVSSKPFFRRVVEETLDFVSLELRDELGGFYSSLDADSEGMEGKYYLWTLEEIRGAFGEKDEVFEAAYGLGEEGNLQEEIILQRAVDNGELANQFGLTEEEVRERLDRRHAELLRARQERVPPATDDKVITSWNGLMMAAYAEAARVLGNEDYLKTAQENADFLLASLREGAGLRRSWRKGRTSGDAFLEDYAALILGLIELYQSDFDSRWYAAMHKLTEEMARKFRDPAGGFFDTAEDAEAVILRPKDLQDNAVPSGNALAAEALLKVAAYSENEEWRQMGEETLRLAAKQAEAYPLAFSRWLSAASLNEKGIRQAAVIGDLDDPKTQELIKELRRGFRPNLISAASEYPAPEDAPDLLKGRKMVDGKPTVYVCENFMCNQPVNSAEDFKAQLA